MDSIRVSEAPDPGSIPGEATRPHFRKNRTSSKSVPSNAFFFETTRQQRVAEKSFHINEQQMTLSGIGPVRGPFRGPAFI